MAILAYYVIPLQEVAPITSLKAGFTIPRFTITFTCLLGGLTGGGREASCSLVFSCRVIPEICDIIAYETVTITILIFRK